MSTDRLPPAEARAVAGELVRRFADRAPGALSLHGVSLAAALEQQVFFALRDGAAAAPAEARSLAASALDFARAGAALGMALLPRSRPDPGPDPILAIIRLPARLTILGPIEAELERRGESLAIVRVARAASAPPPRPGSPRLLDLLAPRPAAGVIAYHARLGSAIRAVRGASGPGDDPRAATLCTVAARELPRIAIGTAAIDSLIRRWRPALLISFDEVGTWSRIIPAVARRHGVPSLNLPHAEAANPVAIAGADYDRFAVFGPKAAAVLAAAGTDRGRIVEVGAPHFDALIARPSAPAGLTDAPRRILFAAQYVQGTMTPAGLADCHRAALAAAAAVAPAEVVVVPHPVQPAGLIEGIVARIAVPDGVSVRVEHSAGLHAVIDSAWVLVTGWSNSVFEAALRRVPSIMVDTEHVSPVQYAAEGLAIGATTEAAAASAARALLDPEFREATIERAQGALANHLGPLDGRSSVRAVDLIVSMARRKVPDRA